MPWQRRRSMPYGPSRAAKTSRWIRTTRSRSWKGDLQHVLTAIAVNIERLSGRPVTEQTSSPETPETPETAAAFQPFLDQQGNPPVEVLANPRRPTSTIKIPESVKLVLQDRVPWRLTGSLKLPAKVATPPAPSAHRWSRPWSRLGSLTDAGPDMEPRQRKQDQEVECHHKDGPRRIVRNEHELGDQADPCHRCACPATPALVCQNSQASNDERHSDHKVNPAPSG